MAKNRWENPFKKTASSTHSMGAEAGFHVWEVLLPGKFGIIRWVSLFIVTKTFKNADTFVPLWRHKRSLLRKLHALRLCRALDPIRGGRCPLELPRQAGGFHCSS